MKSIKDLQAIRDKMRSEMNVRNEDTGGARIVVGMATCGIAAGARDVLNALVEEMKNQGIDNINVAQSGCIGLCQFEPIIDIYLPGKEKTTYGKVDADKVARIVKEHLIGGKVVSEYTIGQLMK